MAGEWVVHVGSLVRGDFAGAPVGTNVDMNSTIAFVRSDAVGAIEIVVNFGPLTGREATLAENDRLARRLLAIADHVRVHAVRTHDMSDETGTIVHQVVVEAEAGQDEAGTIRDACEAWAVECAEERSLEPLEP